MIYALIAVFLVAIIDWFAVAKGWKKVEHITKPLTLTVLILGVMLTGLLETGFRSLPFLLVALGLVFSLAGDIFLLFSDRWFMPGLIAFLLAHVAYIFGLNLPLPDVSPFWSFGLAILLALIASRVLRPIIIAVRQKGMGKLALPISIYGIVITLMLLSALLTLYRTEWTTLAAGLVSGGACLFYLSDVILAWNKFVSPIKNGRLVNMVCYHLGQIALAVGAYLQFGQ